MLKQINSDDGYIYIEIPCLQWIRDNNAFYDVAYEHANYFSLKSLTAMFDDKFLSAGHNFGGQYVYVIAKLSDLSQSFSDIYYDESNWAYWTFNQLFPEFELALKEIESKIVDKRKVYMWGGAGKAGTFFFHCSNQ